MVCVTSKNENNAAVLFGVKKNINLLAAQDVLFRAGDAKTYLYRVESGVICLYDPRWNGDKAFVDFIFPGDFVGLGFLAMHTLTAQAMVETHVACLPLSMAAAITAGDRRAEAKLAEAIEREFETRRDVLNAVGISKPFERVAALLVNLSCSNSYEGRNPFLLTAMREWETTLKF